MELSGGARRGNLIYRLFSVHQSLNFNLHEIV